LCYLQKKFLESKFDFIFYSFYYVYKNGRTDVCLSVGMWRVNGNPNPWTDLDEIFHAHPHLSKEGFRLGLTAAPLTPWAWGARNPKR